MKPIAFRIRDFKSIKDSGTCQLSGDSITVLAGQNEAGKTAILCALRDFDLETGKPPVTAEFEPEDERPNALPIVSVLFEVDHQSLVSDLREENLRIPFPARRSIYRDKKIWITRDLRSGQFRLEPELASLWHTKAPADESAKDPEIPEANETDSTPAQEAAKTLDASDFASWLRSYWPSFIYFDSFNDALPRQVEFADLKPTKTTPAPQTTPGALPLPRRNVPPKAPPAALDFVTLAEIDVDRIHALADNDKNLGNYLSSRSTSITGDFLTYWKQKTNAAETVDIKAKALRDAEGTLKLAFLVHDNTDQYPDQRSKGFLWFLSFYLKLAAAQKREPDRERVLLIDEPGSYLHARAQRDVLHLFESRIALNDVVIYSTHSPYLMPPSSLHRLRIVLKTSPQGTRVLDRLTHPDLRGSAHADSLSPVITAIGIDISQSITFNKKKNLFVEGITDLLYLAAWSTLRSPEILDDFNIFPGSSATTIPTLASLFTGWGHKFITLLDNDDQGKSTRDKLTTDLLVPPARIVRPVGAKNIEDHFSTEDFRTLLQTLDQSLTLNVGEAPSAAIKRQSVDKVLLARTFSEQVAKNKVVLTKKSQDTIDALLTNIVDAWDR